MLILQSFIILFLSLPLWAADDPQDTAAPAADASQAPSQDAPESSDASETTSTQQQDIPRITPDKAKQRFAAVIRHLKLYQRENEIVEISGNETPLMGLYLPENTGKPQGGILILHDIAQHAHWPHTITPIREYLPDYGWNTLSIFFDAYIEKPLPKVTPYKFSKTAPVSETSAGDSATQEAQENTATTDTTATDEADTTMADANNTDTSSDNPPNTEPADNPADNNGITEDPLDAVANSLDEVPEFTPAEEAEPAQEPEPPIEETFIEGMVLRTEQGLQKLNDMGQFNIVIIANGYSANWAAQMLEKRISGKQKGYALILIDAKASTYPQVDLNASLAKLDIPMLDIITEDAPEHLRASKQRKGTMLREQNKQYMQLFLPAIKPSLSTEDNMIARRIRGWLLTHAAGEEVAVKVKNY